VTPEVDKATTFGISGGGDVNPVATNTDSAGVATSTYTTDLGAATAVANIQASVVIDAIKTLIGAVQITRNGLGGDEVDITRSTISASTPVWISTDGTYFSTVIVTLRNNADAPLSGKSVTLSTSRGSTVDFIKAPNPNTTDADGIAIFEVWSSTVGITTVRATIGVAQLSTDVEFIPNDGTTSRCSFNLTVPFQARDYDNKVWVVIKHNGAEKNNANEEFKKNAHNASNPDLLPDLQGIKFYLSNGASDTYTVWVKGKNHLAASKTTVKTSDADGTGTININFGGIITGGIKIGDIATATGTAQIKPGYHDNIIGKMSGMTSSEDLGLLHANWFKAFDLGDFTQDGIINSIDMLYLFLNWGAGAPLP